MLRAVLLGRSPAATPIVLTPFRIRGLRAPWQPPSSCRLIPESEQKIRLPPCGWDARSSPSGTSAPPQRFSPERQASWPGRGATKDRRAEFRGCAENGTVHAAGRRSLGTASPTLRAQRNSPARCRYRLPLPKSTRNKEPTTSSNQALSRSLHRGAYRVFRRKTQPSPHARQRATEYQPKLRSPACLNEVHDSCE